MNKISTQREKGVDMKKILIAIVFLTGILILFWPATLSDEEKINQTLNNAISGLSERDISLVMDALSDEYLDEDKLNKKSIKGMLFVQFQRKQGLIVRLSDKELTINPPKATIKAPETHQNKFKKALRFSLLFISRCTIITPLTVVRKKVVQYGERLYSSVDAPCE